MGHPPSAWTDGPIWGNRFTIDTWGNLTNKDAYSGRAMYEPFSQAVNVQNRFIGGGYAYDAAGNMTNDGSHQYQYDAENRLVTVDGSIVYAYDGDGKRVKKSSGTLYWTGAGSDPLVETDLSGNVESEYIFFNGKRIARIDSSGNVFYYFADHLGTSRVITDSAGGVCYDADSYPYGTEQNVYRDICPQHYKFTGKERDAETGLDYFGARYYGSTMGRFLSPDEFPGGPVDLFDPDDPASQALPYADILNPQSLNKYSYTFNNPLRYTDPDGHCVWDLCVGEAVLVGAAIVTTTYVLHTYGDQIKEGLKGLGDAIATPFKNVEPYEVGPYSDLKGRSVPGDGLDIHHVPQAQPAGQTIEGYDKTTGPAIALPQDEHKSIPTDKGDAKRFPQDQLKKDINDLKTRTKAPTEALKKLRDLNKQQFPKEFSKPKLKLKPEPEAK